MALLQISEPGMSTAPHQHRLAVGIDLGTTNSLVATVRNSISMVLNDEDGSALLPSVVRYLADGNVQVGYAAQAVQSEDPTNTIVSAKRFMGRGLADMGDVSNMPYRFVDAPGMVQLRTVAGVKSPVEISAEILRVLRARAEDALGGELVGAVYSIEVVPELATRAAQLLARLGYTNVHVKSGDGNAGWPEHGPYDGILVTAGGPRIPPALVAQLKPGGRMVIPIGTWPHGQELTLVDKDEDGRVHERAILPVAFVPLIEKA